MALKVLASRLFMKSYDIASITLLEMAKGAMRDFHKKFRDNPKTCLLKYDRVKGISQDVREVDIGHSERMLVHFKGNSLYLLEMGGHEVVRKYVERQGFDRDICLAVEAPKALCGKPIGFFAENPSEWWKDFNNEGDRTWIYYLGAEQAEVFEGVKELLEEALLSDRSFHISVILGGPGTGKTSVLTKVFEHVREQGYRAQMYLEPQLAEYIAATTRLGKEVFSAPEDLDDCKVDVIVVDDPLNKLLIRDVIRRVRLGQFKVAVLGFDPLQVKGDLTDEDIHGWEEARNVSLWRLKVCYRQKEIVGRATQQALEAIAKSNRYLANDKKERFLDDRQRITTLANKMKFINPSGYTKVYEDATLDDLEREMRRINKPSRLWRHWPPLLVAYDDECGGKVPEHWEERLNLVPRHSIRMSAASTIKGVEYQHVFLFIGTRLYEMLEDGFEGAGTNIYEMRQLYRIPLSRAKDSFVVFVYWDG